MWNEYAREKLAELERERRNLPRAQAPARTPSRRRAVPLARNVGRSLQDLGAAIERLGVPASVEPFPESTDQRAR
jgi:hypothetical protein